jgi:hypothetical protein
MARAAGVSTPASAELGWVGRLRPGAAPETRWLAVAQGAQLWGLAVDSMRQRLYVSSASGHMIHQVSLSAAAPVLMPFTRDVDEPNKLAVGPGGVVFFADSDTKIYRVQPSGDLYEVSRDFGGNAAAGVAFGKAGELPVGTLSNWPIFKLVIAGGVETSRTMVGSFRG